MVGMNKGSRCKGRVSKELIFFQMVQSEISITLSYCLT